MQLIDMVGEMYNQMTRMHDHEFDKFTDLYLKIDRGETLEDSEQEALTEIANRLGVV